MFCKCFILHVTTVLGSGLAETKTEGSAAQSRATPHFKNWVQHQPWQMSCNSKCPAAKCCKYIAEHSDVS